MADKFTPLILDALTRAAAEPAGVPLFASKTAPGLFPASTAGKPAAKKAVDDGLLEVLRTESRGKAQAEICIPSKAGMQFLLAEASPKQVLEDLVRILEERRTEVRELLANAARMAVGLERLAEVVGNVLPKVEQHQYRCPAPSTNGHRDSHPIPDEAPMAELLPMPQRATIAVMEPIDDLAEVILARLADWTASEPSARDCPLPDLFRSLSMRDEPPTIGQFHDCLRTLHEQRGIYLHPWTGPLYALPEPQLALLVGHEVAFYASVRNA